MNKRLTAIAGYIRDGVGFIDVGTDHGYLPVYMVQNGYTGNVIASDINEGPLSAAVKTARQAGVYNKIRFLLCDGLRLCESGSVDTIVIAGMGGDMICRILDDAEWCMDSDYTLILQPMTKAEVLRYWLVNNGFSIETEDYVPDSGFIYQIIVARFGGKTVLSDAELLTGKYDLAADKPMFLSHFTSVFKRVKKIVENMEQSDRSSSSARLRLFKDILCQLETMRNSYGKNM